MPRCIHTLVWGIANHIKLFGNSPNSHRHLYLEHHHRYRTAQSEQASRTCIAAGLAVLRVTGLGAVHAGAERGQRRSRRRSLLGLLPLLGLGALLITVALAQVVEAKVLDLVAAAAAGRAALGALLGPVVLLVLEAEELQLGLLLRLCLGGSEPGVMDTRRQTYIAFSCFGFDFRR